jgi:hypothetical protein
MRVHLKTKRNARKRHTRKEKRKIKSKKMRGGYAPMSEWGNVISNLGYLSQSGMNMFSVPIPTLVGQLPDSPLMSQQLPIIKPLLLD